MSHTNKKLWTPPSQKLSSLCPYSLEKGGNKSSLFQAPSFPESSCPSHPTWILPHLQLLRPAGQEFP